MRNAQRQLAWLSLNSNGSVDITITLPIEYSNIAIIIISQAKGEGISRTVPTKGK